MSEELLQDINLLYHFADIFRQGVKARLLGREIPERAKNILGSNKSTIDLWFDELNEDNSDNEEQEMTVPNGTDAPMPSKIENFLGKDAVRRFWYQAGYKNYIDAVISNNEQTLTIDELAKLLSPFNYKSAPIKQAILSLSDPSHESLNNGSALPATNLENSENLENVIKNDIQTIKEQEAELPPVWDPVWDIKKQVWRKWEFDQDGTMHTFIARPNSRNPQLAPIR